MVADYADDLNSRQSPFIRTEREDRPVNEPRRVPVNSQYHGPPLKHTPKWKRELRIFRRDGLVRYVRSALALRRFHRSVRRAESAR